MNATRLCRILGTVLCAIWVTAAPLPSNAENRSDMWWNPDESGWGLIIVDHETDMFAIWCTYLEHGAASAFSGPLARGDVATVAHHLEALRALPWAQEIYVALARSALRTLPVRNRDALQRLLGGSEKQ